MLTTSQLIDEYQRLSAWRGSVDSDHDDSAALVRGDVEGAWPTTRGGTAYLTGVARRRLHESRGRTCPGAQFRIVLPPALTGRASVWSITLREEM